MIYEPKVMVCSVRRLNANACRTGVRSVVATIYALIVCIYETKLSVVTHSIIMRTLGVDFYAYICCPATDGR
jgi:hypothetical protein